MVSSEKSIFILADSMLKHVQGWDATKTVNNEYRVFIGSLAWAETTCMNEYIKPPWNHPWRVVIHLGASEGHSEKLEE